MPPSNLAKTPAPRRFILSLLLLIATLAAYRPVLQNAFVNYDDPRYIVHNSHIQSGLSLQSIRWATTSYYESNWHPITWISHALDISLFQLNPAGHHSVNILLHALNALLLFFILQNATGQQWESFFVAALFALHPINVESVAWASERKNVLSMTLLLLALYAYEKYAQRRSAALYLAVLAAFACGLAAKPQIVTLPFLFLLWDFWPLRRWNPFADAGQALQTTGSTSLSALGIEKLPLLALSAISAVITMRAQSLGGAIQTANALGHTVAAYAVHVRIENAAVAYARYLKLAVWPVQLAPMYPHPGNSIRALSVLLSAFLLLAITAVVLNLRRHAYLPVGWFWFLGSLVPMIGLVQVGSQAMADRYAYLPFVGLFCMAVFGFSDLTQRYRRGKQVATMSASIILLVFGALAFRQAGIWKTSESLWNHTLQVTENNFVAHDSLAEYLFQQGRFAEACRHSQSSVNIFPDDMPAREALAICAQARGDAREAIERYQDVLRLAVEPNIRATAFANLGSIHRKLHDYPQAKASFESALQLNPDLPIALVGSGLLAQKGWDFSLAAKRFAHAMNIEPTSVGYLLLANALDRSGQTAEAGQALEQARRLSGNLQNDQRIADGLMSE
jgi:protein O-mannosyl-transferase